MQLLARCHFNHVTCTVTCMGAMSIWPTLSDTWWITCLFLSVVVVVHYAWAVFTYRRAHQRQLRSTDDTPRVPPTYPEFIPVLGNLMGMGLNSARFVHKAT